VNVHFGNAQAKSTPGANTNYRESEFCQLDDEAFHGTEGDTCRCEAVGLNNGVDDTRAVIDAAGAN
jgi:hypothetical protein